MNNFYYCSYDYQLNIGYCYCGKYCIAELDFNSDSFICWINEETKENEEYYYNLITDYRKECLNEWNIKE